MRPSRRGLAALALAAPLPLLGACAYLSPSSTETDYDAANGVTATVGDVLARDLVVVGDKGGEGLVSGALVNTGKADAAVTIETKGQPQPVKVTVPPGGLVRLGSGTDDTSVVVGDLAQGAGSLLEVTLSSPSGGSVVTSVPVVLPRFEYATVTPTAN
ncbi:hypothetical protein GCM10027446_02130 [Angustibacter peucedani]